MSERYPRVTNYSIPWAVFKDYIRVIDSEGKDFIDLYGTDSRIDLAVKLTQAHINNDISRSLIDLVNAVERLCKIQVNKQ
tara:strand:- start:410 stop:649 length:240 start_codon:yes stop_codon:yes gene_type:complete